MAIPETDNRVQFPPTPIDFDNQVGTTGQTHDTYPAGSQQPRYDWMRMFLIGLLSHQSSTVEPTQYRTGTTWYNRDKGKYEYYNGSAFVDLSAGIVLEEDSSSQTTLASWYAAAKLAIQSIRPRYTFSGVSSADNITQIPIPTSIQTAMTAYVDDLHPIVYINGLMLDPRLSEFSVGCPNNVVLLGGTTLDANDKFIVVIEHFDLEISEDVVA